MNMSKVLAGVIACVLCVGGYALTRGGVAEGIVEGMTIEVVKGWPGALSGRPDPLWKPPPIKAVGRAKLYWLKIDGEDGYKLFSTTSNRRGKFKIVLPQGKYLMASESEHRWELEDLRRDGKADTNSLIRTLFMRRGPQGTDILRQEEVIELSPGKRIWIPVVVSCIYVD